jgi:hypothetical protein
MGCLGEVAGMTQSFGDLENSGLPLQKSPHKDIREEPSLSDARLAKNQAKLLPVGYILRSSEMLQPVFVISNKDIVHLPICPTDE